MTNQWKFAAASCFVGWAGRDLVLNEDQAWPAGDPFVIARPEFFKDFPSRYGTSELDVPGGQPPLERAVTDGGREKRARG